MGAIQSKQNLSSHYASNILSAAPIIPHYEQEGDFQVKVLIEDLIKKQKLKFQRDPQQIEKYKKEFEPFKNLLFCGVTTVKITNNTKINAWQFPFELYIPYRRFKLNKKQNNIPLNERNYDCEYEDCWLYYQFEATYKQIKIIDDTIIHRMKNEHVKYFADYNKPYPRCYVHI